MNQIIKFCTILFISMSIVSCTHKLQFKSSVSKPKPFRNVKTLAIGEVKLIRANKVSLQDNLGNWTAYRQKIQTKGLDQLVRSSLVSNLSTFSDYEVIDLNDFKHIYGKGNRLNSIKPQSGLKFKQIDAILNVSFTVTVVRQSGQYDGVKKFRSSSSTKTKKGWKTTSSTTTDRVVRIPYQINEANIMLTGEVVRVKDGKVLHLGSFTDTIVVSLGTGSSSYQQKPKDRSGFFSKDKETKDSKVRNLAFYKLNHQALSKKPSSPANIANRIAIFVSNSVLPKFSRYVVVTTRTIDTGGDSKAVKLLKKAKVDEARRRIEELISKSKKNKTAGNLYNLGISYEAIGQFRIATQYYEEALSKDEGNELYIEALGALENGK
jgi:hypothetical protein